MNDIEKCKRLNEAFSYVSDKYLGMVVYTVPFDDKQDYRLCFYTDKNGQGQNAAIDMKELKIEDADYVFPDARKGNIPIGTFQTFDELQIEDIGEDGT